MKWMKGNKMKKLYSVYVANASETSFEEYYSEEEVKTILKFFKDLSKHEVPSYDIPLVEFEII